MAITMSRKVRFLLISWRLYPYNFRLLPKTMLLKGRMQVILYIFNIVWKQLVEKLSSLSSFLLFYRRASTIYLDSSSTDNSWYLGQLRSLEIATTIPKFETRIQFTHFLLHHQPSQSLNEIAVNQLFQKQLGSLLDLIFRIENNNIAKNCFCHKVLLSWYFKRLKIFLVTL